MFPYKTSPILEIRRCNSRCNSMRFGRNFVEFGLIFFSKQAAKQVSAFTTNPVCHSLICVVI